MYTHLIKIALASTATVVLLVLGSLTIHKVDDTEWQAVQYLNGEVEIKESAGVYLAMFPKVTEYPRNETYEFTGKDPNIAVDDPANTDDSIRVTFNDGGTAQISTVLRVSTPATKEQKREFHRQFNGSKENIKSAIWAHLSNVIKATGPIMSASENQTARKSEFNSVVLDQMNDGLYQMRRVMVELDQVDEKGNKIKVMATEIQKSNDGKSLVAQSSPLATYGLKVTQLSITETEYDKQTQTQFETKKAAFLKAESAKAEREGEVQQRLMIEEKGRRELAETTAAANLVKEKATIEAAKEKEVAETNAARELEVAKLAKEQAETLAAQKLEVAKLDRQASEEQAKQILVLAQAEKERIAMAGAITEKDKVTLEVQRETAIGVAQALSKVSVPQVIIAGGKDDQNASSTQSDLINLFLLKQNGLLDAMNPKQVNPAPRQP
jgi:hypothetical protein